MKPSVIYTGKSITVVFQGKPHTLNQDSRNFAAAVQAYRNQDDEALLAALDIGTVLHRFSVGDVKVYDGIVTYKGEQVGNALVTRIIDFLREGLPYEPMARFLSNLMENPAESARQELYLFLESGYMPLTEDGCFLAYRRVGKDYLSITANVDGTKNRNKVGDVVIMPREACDPNRNSTCSRGLHFCSYSYLQSFNGEHTMLVKINPRDVVSIPSDHDNAKGRCCRYEVVDEVVNNSTNILDKKPLARVMKRKSRKTKQRIKFVVRNGKKKVKAKAARRLKNGQFAKKKR